VQCKRHPEIETNLTCGKCGDPICPRCLVHTPVGARCPSCARLTRLPTFAVSGRYYLRAIGAGLGVALGTGLIWGFIQWYFRFFYLSLLLGGATGYAIGEMISLAVNRKRGTGLQIIASLAVVVSYLISLLSFWQPGFNLFDILAVAAGIFVAITRLR